MKLAMQLKHQKTVVENKISEALKDFQEETGFRVTEVRTYVSFDAFGNVDYNVNLEVSE